MFCSRCGHDVGTPAKYCPNCALDLTGPTQVGLTGTGAQSAPDDSAAVREALKDEYELEKELGRGGMAIVYKARDKALERDVAIKVLPLSLSFDAEFVERFQREARTSARLEHPNIIPIHRVGKSGRVIFFVMKFIRGQSLSSLIASGGALPVPQVKRVLIEAGRALGYAHKHGIVHRDIKPDNIMFDEMGQAIVADFGIAKAQSGARLTATGISVGTPHYMSPEQARAQTLDGRSDIYSLGVVGYQCLTGRVPFDGEDSFSVGYKHIMEELPTPALETAEQRELFAIIQRMLAKNPDDRFQSAEELVADLEGWAGDTAEMSTDVGSRPPGAIKAAPVMAATVERISTPLPRASGPKAKPPVVGAPAGAAPQPARAPRPAGTKSRTPVFAAAGVVVVIAAVAGYYLLGHKGGAAGAASGADTTRQTLAVASQPGAVTGASGKAGSVVVPAVAPAHPQPQPQAQSVVQPVRPALKSGVPAVKEPVRAAAPVRATAPATARTGCDDAAVSERNAGGACWDTKPRLTSRPEVTVPASCGAAPLPAELRINVHVTQTGDVREVWTSERIQCKDLVAAAVAAASDFKFSPATLRGGPTSAWLQVPVKPVRRR
jgi:predicted Ser/Thr protein kinase